MLRTRLIAGATSGFVLSAVLATALTIANFGETLVEPWRVDPAEPAPITLRLPRRTLGVANRAADHSGPASSTMVARGEIAQPEIAPLVRLYERDRRPPRPFRLAAHWVVYFMVVLLLTTYLRKGPSRTGVLLRTQVGLLLLLLVFLIGNKALLLFTPLSAHLVPVAVVPLWATLYMDRRTGAVTGVVATILSASFVTYDPIVSITYIIACAGATLTFRYRKRAWLMLVGGLLAGAGAACVYVAAKEIFDGFLPEQEIAAGLAATPLSCLLGGIAAGVIAFIFHPLVARLIGVVSRSQLMNLADLDQPLLKKMSAEAPGSWEHSRAMANLAEGAAAAIHADAQLTRIGAYYHDLGKTCQAKYFVENLAPGERSPHEDLEPEVSADAIMAHVIEGTRILREGGIPEPVVEFAYTHHGTSVIEYFWHKCLRQGNPRGLHEDAFRYPGMKPRTKETAILMLVDSIEAGGRTVEPPSREGFEEMVRRVIFVKMSQGQLDDSGLTIEDLRILANQITDTLCSVYHSRIRYPWQDKDKDKDKDSESDKAKDREREPVTERDEDKKRERELDEEPSRESTPPARERRDSRSADGGEMRRSEPAGEPDASPERDAAADGEAEPPRAGEASPDR